MSGKAPLHVAAYHGRVEEVAVLLAAGANVDEDVNGDTPLLIACEQGHDEVVLRMITAKASVNLADIHTSPQDEEECDVCEEAAHRTPPPRGDARCGAAEVQANLFSPHD
jgi:hypothetical protein